MAYTHGMNVETVRGIGNQLQNVANNDIAALITNIGNIVTNATQNWSGSDSNQFDQEWTGTHRKSLVDLQTALLTFAGKALTNASNQEIESTTY